MGFFNDILPLIGTVVGGAIGGPQGAAIGGTLGSAVQSKSTPTLTQPGGTGALRVPPSITTPSLSLSSGGSLQRTAPAFIPGQPTTSTAVGPTVGTQPQIFGTPTLFRDAAAGPTLPGLDRSQEDIGRSSFVTRGDPSAPFSVDRGRFGVGRDFGGGAATTAQPAVGAIDPRLQEEQDVRRRLSELNPMLGDILAQIEASRGDVGQLGAATTQLGTDVQAFREGLNIPTKLQPSADELRTLAALAAGADISELERLGMDVSALKDAAGNIDTARLQQAIQIAEQVTGQPLTEEGIAALEAGGQLAADVQTQGAFATPLGALAQARGAAVSEEGAFTQLREDIGAFRETLAPHNQYEIVVPKIPAPIMTISYLDMTKSQKSYIN